MNFNRLARQPLHQQVAARIRSLAATKFTPGQRLPSESDLAREFRVSIRTVREALSALVQEGSVERRHGVGTFVGQRPIGHVALWLTINPLLGKAEYAHAVLRMLYRYLAEQDLAVRAYTVVGANDNFDHDVAYQDLLQGLAQKSVRAVGVVAGPFSEQVVELAGQQQVPIVCSTPIENATHVVCFDVPAMVQRATEYLVGQGCRKIAYMGWHVPDRQIGSLGFHAFESALRAHGLTLRPEWVRGDLNPTLAGAGYEEFREIWTARTDKPDGLVVVDDVLFRDVATAIWELGIRVPEQLKVVAHANKGMVTAPFFPAPRWECDPEACAHAMGGMLARLARGEVVESPRVMLGYRWVESYLSPAHALAEQRGNSNQYVI